MVDLYTDLVRKNVNEQDILDMFGPHARDAYMTARKGNAHSVDNYYVGVRNVIARVGRYQHDKERK
jgi:hypothetical protein